MNHEIHQIDLREIKPFVSRAQENLAAVAGIVAEIGGKCGANSG